MRVLTFGLILALSVAAGCTHEGPQPTASTVQYGIPNQAAVMNISNARCNHEATCNAIGKGKAYDNFEVCTQQVSRDANETLQAEACPNGVSTVQLSSCVTDLQDQKCDARVQSVDDVDSCTRTKLCI